MIKTRRQFLRIFAIIIIWSGLLAFVELVWRFGVLKEGFFPSQVSVIVGQKNHFAAFMTMVAPLSFIYSLMMPRLSKKIFFLLAALVISISVFLSSSDAGIGGLVFSLIIMSFFLLKNKLIKISRWGIAGIILFIVAVLLFLVFDGYPLHLYKQLGSRLKPAKDSLQIIKDFPLFGVGGGNFRYIFSLYRSFQAPFYNYLHNEFLQLIIEKGIVGSIFYFLFFIFLFKEIIIKINKRKDRLVKCLSIGILSGLFGVLGHSFFEFNFHIPAIEIKFWILLALVYKYLNTYFYKARKENEKISSN
ncbi:MAG: O-antigen ligase family protein [Candidatus Omnitrophota bacterium]